MCISNIEISLIIPVYNCEKYLRAALMSVVEQTFNNFEVIMVNDGSTDSSLDIMNEFAGNHQNFHVIDQPNTGPGPARNNAIKIATGKFVAFLDGDDLMSPNFLEILYNTAIKTDADIVCCNYKLLYPSGLKFWLPSFGKVRVLNSVQALKRLILDVSMHHYAWNKIYKRSLFIDNDIEFYNMYFEDITACPKLFYFAEKVAVIPHLLYYYRKHSLSILGSLNVRKINDFTRTFGVMRNFFELKNIYHIYRRRFKLYGFRVKLQNYYAIFRFHAAVANMKGFFANCKNSDTAIKLFMADSYTALQDPPDLPAFVFEPTKRKLKKSVANQ